LVEVAASDQGPVDTSQPAPLVDHRPQARLALMPQSVEEPEQG
jgi:hypothetical protein